MSNFEKTISNLVASQFPAFYAEEAGNFIPFMKAYYEWMEEQGPLYHSRRLMDYRDIDTTIDSFLIHFKNKYLSGITLDTAVETKRVVKHALDMYRSKGTERSIDLFFKNLFGTSAEIYYPGDDVFKTSDGKWFVPRYLEVDASANARSFIGLQVEGIESGATAYIEKYVIKKHKGTSRYAYVYYINKPVGSFLKGERIRSTKNGSIGPVVLGSVNELNVISSSTGYEIGDIVTLSSEFDGIDGKARVTSVLTDSGKISFELIDGGWGYRSNSEILVSEKVLTISDLVYEDGNNFDYFDTIVQPLSEIVYTNSNGSFSVGDLVIREDEITGNVITAGIILSINATSNTDGILTVSVISGLIGDEPWLALEDAEQLELEDSQLMVLEGLGISDAGYIDVVGHITQEDLEELFLEDGGLFISEDSAVHANLVSSTDFSVSANLMGISNSVTVVVTTDTITKFANNEMVYQGTIGNEAANGQIVVVSHSGSNSTMRIADYKGAFSIGDAIYSRTANTFGTVVNVSTSIGVVDIAGTNPDFTDAPGNILKTFGSTNTVSTVTRISRGSGAAFEVANTFLYTKDVEVNIDFLEDYESVELDSPDYGFPIPGTEDINTILLGAMTFTSANVGRISSIVTKNEGTDYDTAPFVLIYESLIARQGKKDYILDIDSSTGNFTEGEVILQGGDELGLVKAGSNSTVLYLQRLSLEDFAANTQITGQLSGFTANVVAVSTDQDSLPVGMDAVILANTASGAGVVSGLAVVDSGFNYRDFETLTFSKEGLSDGTAEARLSSYGFSEGYYKSNNGQTSGNKYLHDGEYYQEYSYEIMSSVPVEKYADILKNVIHMAGTKHFSRFVKRSLVDSTVSASSTLTIE